MIPMNFNFLKTNTMKRLFATLTILAMSIFTYAQVGTINNVHVEQRDDGTGIVDIRFDLSGPANSMYNIVLEVSFDGGDSFSVLPANYLSMSLEEVSPAANIELEWDGMASHPNVYTEEAQIKIVATLIEDDDPGTTLTDIDGNVYGTIIIGDQEWMTENLRVTHYNNGDPIATGLTDEEWAETEEGAYAVYPHIIVPGIGSDEEMAEIYGLLYNWHAFYTDDRGLCPEGWHVPSQADWDALIGPLGGQLQAGAPLKGIRTEPDDHPRWDAPNTGATGESGMNLYPSGQRRTSGSFADFGERIYIWTTEWAPDADDPDLIRPRAYRTEHDDTRSRRYRVYMEAGYSIRCVRNLDE